MVHTLVVVDKKEDWGLKIDNIEIVEAKSYIKNKIYNSMRNVRVLNLCRSYTYQRLGYYVSLVAAARGHRPQPTLKAIEDFKSPSMIRFVSNELDEIIQKSLKHIISDQFVMSVYFGKNIARCYDRLATYLYKQFHAPFLQAKFSRYKNKWVLVNVNPIASSQIPNHHFEFATQCIYEYLQGKRITPTTKKPSRYDLAILYNPDEKFPPSNKKALQRFLKAGESLGFNVEMIQKCDIGRLFEFDALFIRETTSVNHYTYRFARKAKANGLEVIDDPESILKCCNKVYLAELLDKHQIPIPRTLILEKDDVKQVMNTITYPCILKQPDSSFSRGVVKIESPETFEEQIKSFLSESDLVIVQEFMPTAFDWRIGIIDGEPLFAAKYFMAKDHWQVYNHSKKGDAFAGDAVTVAIEDVPKLVVKTAVKAAQLIGNGFYGVDLKEIDGKCVVIEINDNPSIDAGVEDELLGDALYIKILEKIANRLDNSRNAISGTKKVCALV